MAPTSFQLDTQSMFRQHVYTVPAKVITDKRRATTEEGVTVTPALVFKAGKDDGVANENDNVGGIIRTTVNGASTMHFFFASSTGMLLSLVISNGFFKYDFVYSPPIMCISPHDTDVPHGKPLGDSWFAWCTEMVDPPASPGLSTGLIVFIGVAGMC